MTQFNLDTMKLWPTFGWPLSSSTSIAALSVYAVGGFDPKLAFDFISNTYKTGGSDSTLANSVTHSRSSQATMTDSDGTLKWAPHNFLPSSDAFADTSATLWSNFGTAAGPHEEVVMSNGATGYRFDVTNNRDFMNYSISVVTGEEYTVKLWIDEVDYTSGDNQLITIFGEVNKNIIQSSFTGAGFYSFTYTSSFTGTRSIRIGAGSSANTTLNFVCGQPHFYRSDLGGMVDNSATGNSYVPTTSSPVYLPRTGHHIYNGSAWVNEGILHESEARTNSVTYSGDLADPSDWTGNGLAGAVTAGSPFGTYQTFSPNGDGSNESPAQRYQIGKTLTSGATYVGWALVKYSAGSGWFVINMFDTSKFSERAWFDVQNGVVGSNDPLIVDHGMIDYGDGWWLCWATSISITSSGGVSVEMPNGDNVVTCSGADVILIAGTQFELGSTPSSYIPTSGATVTRAAETLTVPAANLPYSSTNMSIQMDGKMTYADTNLSFEVEPYKWQQDSINYINSNVSTLTGRTGQGIFSQRQPTSGYDGVAGTNTDYSPSINVPFNLAARHGSTFLNGAHEGTLLTANTTPTILPDLSSTDLNLGSTFMGTIGQFRMWDEDLTDAGIIEASAPSTEPSLQLTFDGLSTNSFTVLDWSE